MAKPCGFVLPHDVVFLEDPPTFSQRVGVTSTPQKKNEKEKEWCKTQKKKYEYRFFFFSLLPSHNRFLPLFDNLTPFHAGCIYIGHAIMHEHHAFPLLYFYFGCSRVVFVNIHKLDLQDLEDGAWSFCLRAGTTHTPNKLLLNHFLKAKELLMREF